MRFGNPALVKKMNEVMLKYVTDIVPVDREKVIQFFEQQNIPYRQDYIDFLARFGGNESQFFKTYEFVCTFQEIQEIYLENAVFDPIPPKGYCVIANQTVADWFIIENSTGKIYCAGDNYDENGICTNAQPVFESIDDFLWFQLFLSTYKNFTLSTSKHPQEHVDNNETFFMTIFKENTLLKTDYLGGTHYFLQGNTLYFYRENENVYYSHTLSENFMRKLYA